MVVKMLLLLLLDIYVLYSQGRISYFSLFAVVPLFVVAYHSTVVKMKILSLAVHSVLWNSSAIFPPFAAVYFLVVKQNTD